MDNKNNRISVNDYLDDKEKLELTYIPFDRKLEIVTHTLQGVIDSIGGLNTSLLRRISTEVFIEAITNIDMNIINENGLKGFDQLCYLNELDNLISLISNEYAEFERIVNERVSDYNRIETNSALAINAIHNQVRKNLNELH